jgi:hypothetical protein
MYGVDKDSIVLQSFLYSLLQLFIGAVLNFYTGYK